MKKKRKIIVFVLAICLTSSIVLIFFISKPNQNKELLNHLFEITQSDISNNIFSLQVPDDWIGHVGYVIKNDPDGTKDAYHISFIHLDSYLAMSETNSLEPTIDTGVLAFIFWHGENNPFYSFSKGDVFNWEEDKKAAPVSYTVLQMNQTKTDAYIIMLPSDIEFTPETQKDYTAFEDNALELMKKIKINVALPN